MSDFALKIVRFIQEEVKVGGVKINYVRTVWLIGRLIVGATGPVALGEFGEGKLVDAQQYAVFTAICAEAALAQYIGMIGIVRIY